MNEENGPAIVAFLGTQAIGDYIMYHLVAASIAREFPGSRLGIIYRDDRPYKTFINSANPYVSAALRVDEDPNAVVPIDLFDGRSDAPDRIPDETWDKLGLYRPDIFLTPSMLSMFACIWPPPAFRVPKEAAETLGQKLKDRGLDGDRWFVCLHIREPGYVHRPGSDPNRDADPTSYLPMIEDIIRNLGGQVVRIGHSDTTPMPEMEGMIDLSREDDCFPEQAFAISRARYFIGSDSGPTQLASAFKTPTATTNAMGLGIWNDGDVALLKTYLGRFDTEPLEFDDVYEILPVLGNRRPVDFTVKDNSAEELVEVSRHLFKATSDCVGWRGDAKEPSHTPSGTLTLPLKWEYYGHKAELNFWNQARG